MLLLFFYKLVALGASSLVLLLFGRPVLVKSWQHSVISRNNGRSPSNLVLSASSSSKNSIEYQTQPNPLFSLTLSRLPRPIRNLLENGRTKIEEDSKITKGHNTQTNDLNTLGVGSHTSHIVLLNKPGDIKNFLSSLPLASKHKAAAKYGSSKKCIQTVPSLFSEQQCRDLRQWATDKIYHNNHLPKPLDTVDGCPEYQVPIDEHTLTKLVGTDSVQTLHKLSNPFLLEASQWEDETEKGTRQQKNDKQANVEVGYFIRSYTPFSRPFLGFHVDDCDATVNICLSHPHEHCGGDLLALSDGKLFSVHPRPQGTATIHPWYCLHGVTSIIEGERWSFIAFFSNTSCSKQLHEGFYKKIFYNNKHLLSSHNVKQSSNKPKHSKKHI
jgi:hypothetical protein